MSDAPISRIDLLISRNTLMYLNAEAQARVLARFFYGLREGGYLFLGKAETLLAHANLFAPVDLKYRFFTKPTAGAELREPLLLGGNAIESDLEADAANERELRNLAFEADPTAQLVVSSDLRLVLANDKARELFGLTSREIGRPLQDLAVSYRPLELRSLINLAIAEWHTVTMPEVTFPQGETLRWFDVQLMPLATGRGRPLGIRISFMDVTRSRQLAEELQQSKRDLETAYEELQSSNEELETTNEELQSTVEELETTNEELQSTNEELETMNEELQSTNEELEAVNDELRERGEDVNNANAFLEAILSSLRAGVAVVDAELRVQAWNQRAEDLWGLRAEEVRTLHLLNLDIGLHIEALLQPIRDCLAGRLPQYEAVVEATNRRGRHIFCRVSLSPMKLTASSISGVVILMEEADNGGNGGV